MVRHRNVTIPYGTKLRIEYTRNLNVPYRTTNLAYCEETERSLYIYTPQVLISKFECLEKSMFSLKTIPRSRYLDSDLVFKFVIAAFLY